MAYVAITDNLIEDVRRSINHMRDAERDAMPDPNELDAKIYALPEVQEVIQNLLWGEFIDLRGRLSRFNRECHVCAIIVAGEREHELHFSHSVKGPIFAKGEYYSPAKFKLQATDHPLLQDSAARHEARAECEERWETVRDNLIKFFRSCKSVNEAVKLWPDVVKYIPQSYIDRLNKKADRPDKVASAAEEMLKTLDVDTIKASTMLARMAGAKV